MKIHNSDTKINEEVYPDLTDPVVIARQRAKLLADLLGGHLEDRVAEVARKVLRDASDSTALREVPTEGSSLGVSRLLEFFQGRLDSWEISGKEIAIRGWQVEFYQSAMDNRFSLVMGSRGCGKDTTIHGIVLTLLASGEDVAIVNKDLRLNREFIGRLRETARDFGIETGGSTERLTVDGGGSIVALSSKVDNLQGLHRHVVVNELGALGDEAEEVLEYAFGSILSDDQRKLIIASNATPPGSWLHNFFTSDEERFQSYRENFSYENITIWDIYDGEDDLPPETQALKSNMRPEAWRRWFENSFEIGSGALFRDGDGKLWSPAPDPGACDKTYAAVDIGVSRDPSAVVVVGRHQGVWHVLHTDRRWNLGIQDQIKWIENAKREFRCRKVMVDAGGVGYHIADELAQKHKWAVKGNWSRSFYARAVEIWEAWLLRGDISIEQKTHHALVDELRKMTHEGDGKMSKPHGKHAGNQTHCDLADALLGAVDIAAQDLGKKALPVWSHAGLGWQGF